MFQSEAFEKAVFLLELVDGILRVSCYFPGLILFVLLGVVDNRITHERYCNFWSTIPTTFMRGR